MKEKHGAAILGYGVPPDIFKDGNYNRYLENAWLAINLSQCEELLLSGGHTNIHYPEKSEAGEMHKYLMTIPGFRESGIIVFKNEDSITSWENIKWIDCMIRENSLTHITIHGEFSRRRKVRLLCRRILSRQVKATVNVIDFDRSRTIFSDLKQMIDFFATLLQFMFPKIRDLRHWRQMRHIKKVSQP
ncbi:hypothetical protein KKA13_04820 [Patescibacteria group bacterium]|nr:hypothetical protein [Patescibacteria group bacterium]